MIPLQQRLERFLKKRRVATIDAMCSAMGRAEITVRQALAKLDYLTSYNQNSRFYTLRSLACFNKHGIWRHSKASFCSHGTLANLLVALVDVSYSGHTVVELEKITGGTIQVALTSLVKKQHLIRIRSGGPYVYFTARSKRKRIQQARKRFGSAKLLEDEEEDLTMETLKRTVAILLEIIRSQPQTQRALRHRLQELHPEIPQGMIGEVCRQYGIRLKKN